MILTELFDKIYKWEWSKILLMPGGASVAFRTNDGSEVIVQFNRDHGAKRNHDVNMYELSFTRGNVIKGHRADVTGGGDAVKIFATVSDILSDFVREHAPDSIIFTGSHLEPSRVKMYRRGLPRIAPSLGMKSANIGSFFVLYKPESRDKVQAVLDEAQADD